MIRAFDPQQDKERLCDLFATPIELHKKYISHGEIQMGIATDPKTLAPNFKEVWLQYLERQYTDPQTSIRLYETDEEGTLAGFIIFGTRDDGAAPYGVIYDLGVLPELRKKGTGSLLVRTALDALREQGVEACYLESGVNNHSAHHFFEQFGFRQVSCVFRNKL